MGRKENLDSSGASLGHIELSQQLLESLNQISHVMVFEMRDGNPRRAILPPDALRSMIIHLSQLHLFGAS